MPITKRVNAEGRAEWTIDGADAETLIEMIEQRDAMQEENKAEAIRLLGKPTDAAILALGKKRLEQSAVRDAVWARVHEMVEADGGIYPVLQIKPETYELNGTIVVAAGKSKEQHPDGKFVILDDTQAAALRAHLKAVNVASAESDRQRELKALAAAETLVFLRDALGMPQDDIKSGRALTYRTDNDGNVIAYESASKGKCACGENHGEDEDEEERSSVGSKIAAALKEAFGQAA